MKSLSVSILIGLLSVGSIANAQISFSYEETASGTFVDMGPDGLLGANSTGILAGDAATFTLTLDPSSSLPVPCGLANETSTGILSASIFDDTLQLASSNTADWLSYSTWYFDDTTGDVVFKFLEDDATNRGVFITMGNGLPNQPTTCPTTIAELNLASFTSLDRVQVVSKSVADITSDVDVRISGVPEPSAALLSGVAWLLCLVTRRRRSAR